MSIARRFTTTACAILSLGASGAFGATTYATGFDGPLYTLGNLHGQDGWTVAFSTATVTDERAFSGTQSILVASTATLGINYQGPTHRLDPNAEDTLFPINAGLQWWMQAMIYIPSSGGSGAAMNMGGCPLFHVTGSGQPYPNSCVASDIGIPSLAPDVYDKWLLMRIEHPVVNTLDLVFSLTGPGVNFSHTLGSYNGPNSGQPHTFMLSGNAYFDEFSAGHGPAPAVVPVPGAIWLFLSSLAAVRGAVRFRRE